MALEDAQAPLDLRGVLGDQELPDVGGGLPGFGSGVPGVPYHERQRRQLCALHALNNLLQRPWLSQAQADRICQRLAPNSRPNPHRSLLGLGNYDVNVVMAALGMLGLAAVWWDKRRPLERLCVPRVLGFLLNVPCAAPSPRALRDPRPNLGPTQVKWRPVGSLFPIGVYWC
ncbi:josephin-2 isoform X3 [Zonotrichia leucophrys gambelii]|uniref:josephin-2 isoform X3 n=1 Tax=Zonotrichia leucophrys gambelii TaxID=257770 RepID=UPI0031401024